MENIVNLQMPGKPSAGMQTRAAQSTDAGDGFLKLLQQKQEAPEAKPKAEEPAKPVKDEKPQAKEEPKKTSEDAQEPQEEDAVLALELAAQQLFVQNAVVTPQKEELTLQPLATEETAAAVTEIGALPQETEQTQFPLETSAEKAVEIPKAAVIPKAAKEPDVSQETVQEAEARPEKVQAEVPVSGQKAGRDPGGDMPKDAQPIREPVSGTQEKTFAGEDAESSSEVRYAAVDQSRSLNQSQAANTPEPRRTEELVLKATVEDLPRELGRALTSGQQTGSRTLTVELEPVSLGKLTIRVEYEAGRTAVSILSSNPKTLELLSEKASEIASILKEHTGEETVIYAQEPQRQEEDQYDGRQGAGQGGQREQKQQKEGERRETESFAQQLRLGLV